MSQSLSIANPIAQLLSTVTWKKTALKGKDHRLTHKKRFFATSSRRIRIRNTFSWFNALPFTHNDYTARVLNAINLKTSCIAKATGDGREDEKWQLEQVRNCFSLIKSIIFHTHDECCKSLCSFSDFSSLVLGVCLVFSCCASLLKFKESVSVPTIWQNKKLSDGRRVFPLLNSRVLEVLKIQAWTGLEP